jgi:hypothetical protein
MDEISLEDYIKHLKSLGLSDRLILANIRMIDVSQKMQDECSFQDIIMADTLGSMNPGNLPNMKDLTNSESDELEKKFIKNFKTYCSFLKKRSQLLDECSSAMKQLIIAFDEFSKENDLDDIDD